MAEYDIREEMFNRDFLQGFLQKRAAKGLKFTPMMPRQVLDADTFTWIEEDMFVEEAIKKGKQHNPRLLPEGAMLEEIKMEGIHSETGKILKRGYSITIGKNLLNRDPTVARSLLNRMGKLSYGLARWIESVVYNNIKEAAIAKGVNDTVLGSYTPLVGVGGKFYDGLMDLEAAYDLDEYSQELNTILYHKGEFKDSKKQLNANEIITQNRIINGWQQGSNFDYMGINHCKSGMFQNAGEIIGFDRDIPFGTLYYGKEDGAYNPKVISGVEKFAPILNVTVKEPLSWEIPKEYTINMLASVGTAIDSPEVLMYSNKVRGT